MVYKKKPETELGDNLLAAKVATTAKARIMYNWRMFNLTQIVGVIFIALDGKSIINSNHIPKVKTKNGFNITGSRYTIVISPYMGPKKAFFEDV